MNSTKGNILYQSYGSRRYAFLYFKPQLQSMAAYYNFLPATIASSMLYIPSNEGEEGGPDLSATSDSLSQPPASILPANVAKSSTLSITIIAGRRSTQINLKTISTRSVKPTKALAELTIFNSEKQGEILKRRKSVSSPSSPLNIASIIGAPMFGPHGRVQLVEERLLLTNVRSISSSTRRMLPTTSESYLPIGSSSTRLDMMPSLTSIRRNTGLA